jgi:hypothetical protein
MGLELNFSEERSAVINVRVTETNKNFIKQMTERYGKTETDIVNAVLDHFRQVEDDSDKGKLRRGTY